jgi:hypothetical protein
MRRTSLKGFFLILIVSFLTPPAFATDPAVPKVEKSLPQEKLARYNDSFDRFQEELWEKVGWIPGIEQREAKFKLADVRVEGGRLRIETATGCFSLGGLGSKYKIRGDFDIQIDCAVEFKSEVHDMEQILQFNFTDVTKELRDRELEAVMIMLTKPAAGEAHMATAYRTQGEFKQGFRTGIGSFKGSLRVTREGNSVSTLYRKEGDPDWQNMRTFYRPPNDVVVGFKVQNFVPMRTSVGASSPFVAFFDNFKINAAQEIIDSDI